MNPLSGLIAAVGIGTSIFGAIKGTEGNNQAYQIQAQQAQLQAQQAQLEQQYTAQQQIVSSAQYGQQVAQINANKKVIGLQQQQEVVRNNAMNIDAQRQKRQAIRDQLAQTSLGIARAVGQGASLGDSSVTGGQAQSYTQGLTNLGNIRMAQGQGNSIFGLNNQITNVNLGLQDQSLGYLKTAYNAQQAGYGIQSQMYGITGQISNLNASLAQAQGKAAEGQALMTLGGSILNNTGNLSGVLTQGGSLFGKLFK